MSIMESLEAPAPETPWGSSGVAKATVSGLQLIEGGKLFPVEQALARFRETEPIDYREFNTGRGSVKFHVGELWGHGASDRIGTDPVDATVTLPDGDTFTLTQDALLEATSICGLPQKYVTRCPAQLTIAALNYWFNEGLDKQLKLLTTPDGIGHAFTRATVVPFSNVEFTERAIKAIQTRYGADEPIMVDSKFVHTLKATYMRIVLPGDDSTGSISTARSTPGRIDRWSQGIAFQNSLIGAESTEINGFMFSWLSAGGAIATHNGEGRWSRRSHGQGEDVYDWMQKSVEDLLDTFDHELDQIEGLTGINLEGLDGEVSKTLGDLFDLYRVPIRSRELITSNLVNSDDLSMFGIMQAISLAANVHGTTDGQVDDLLRIAGDLPAQSHDRCGECRRVKM